jgi:hypothetical protein
MSLDFGRYLLWVLAADVVAGVLCWLAWKRARARKPDFRLQFGITDLWFLMLSLAPAMWFGAQLDERLALLFLALLLPQQLAGVFFFRMDSPRFPIETNMPLWKSAVLTFSGAILGCMLPPVTLALALVVLFALLLIVVSLPISLPVTFGYWLWRQEKPVQDRTGS